MIAGMPGIGISGIFYLLCACLMPVIELVHLAHGKSSKKRWQLVTTQFAYFCGIMASTWLLGLALGAMLQYLHSLFGGEQTQANLFRLTPMALSLLTLSAVLGIIHLTNFFIRKRKKAMA